MFVASSAKTANVARTKLQTTGRDVVGASGSIVFVAAVLWSAHITDRNIQQWSSSCLLSAYNLPAPERWTA